MSISADRNSLPLFYLHLHHGRLIVHELLDRQYDLEHIFLRQLLPILESRDHVVNELLCHLLAQLHTIVALLQRHMLQIQALGRTGRIFDLNRLEERIPLDHLVALDHAHARRRVLRGLLDHQLPVA
jgi:hypothetical protein